LAKVESSTVDGFIADTNGSVTNLVHTSLCLNLNLWLTYLSLWLWCWQKHVCWRRRSILEDEKRNKQRKECGK